MSRQESLVCIVGKKKKKRQMKVESTARSSNTSSTREIKGWAGGGGGFRDSADSCVITALMNIDSPPTVL